MIETQKKRGRPTKGSAPMSQAERSRLLRQRKAATAVPLEVVESLTKAASDMLLSQLHDAFNTTYGTPVADEPWSDILNRRDRVCAELDNVVREFKEAYSPAWPRIAENVLGKLDSAVERENEAQEAELYSGAWRVPGAEVAPEWMRDAVRYGGGRVESRRNM